MPCVLRGNTGVSLNGYFSHILKLCDALKGLPIGLTAILSNVAVWYIMFFDPTGQYTVDAHHQTIFSSFFQRVASKLCASYRIN